MYQFQLEFWNVFKKLFCYNTGLRHLYESKVKAWKNYDRLAQIPINEMKKIIKEENIKTLIIDMDGTLKHRKYGLIEENKKWIQNIRDYVNIYVISNANEELTSKVANELNLPYIYKAKKPSSYGFNKICELTNAKKEEIIVIGDAIRADIIGANKAGITKTILLKDLNIIGLEHGKDEYEIFYYRSLYFIIFSIISSILCVLYYLFKFKRSFLIILNSCSLILIFALRKNITTLYNKHKHDFNFFSIIHIFLWIVSIYWIYVIIKIYNKF